MIDEVVQYLYWARVFEHPVCELPLAPLLDEFPSSELGRARAHDGDFDGAPVRALVGTRDVGKGKPRVTEREASIRFGPVRGDDDEVAGVPDRAERWLRSDPVVELGRARREIKMAA